MKKTIILMLLLLFTGSAIATVSDGESIRQYFTCNGSTTTFTFTQPVNSEDDVLVWKHLISTGVETSLVQDTDYTIASTGGDYLNGGVVTISPALASTFRVVILREIKKSQETTTGATNPNSVRLSLDKLTRVVQDLEDRNDRSIHLQESDGTTFDMELPGLALRASKYLFISDTGALALVDSIDTSSTTISSFAETYLDDATASATLATLGAMGEVINVKAAAYGAVGNGVADDTAALQAAFAAGDALVARYTIYFPPGEYLTTAEVALEAARNCLVIGYGAKITSTSTGNVLRFGEDGGGTTKRFVRTVVAGLEISSTTADALILLAGHQSQQNTFRDLTLTGDDATPANVVHGVLVYNTGSQGATYWNKFDRVTVAGCNYNFSLGYSFSAAAASAENPNRTILNNCLVSNIGVYGCWIGGNAYLYNFSADGTGGTSDVFLASSGSRSYVHGNFESDGTNGVEIESGATGNTIEGFFWGYSGGANSVIDRNSTESTTLRQTEENDIRYLNASHGNLHAFETLRAVTWRGYDDQDQVIRMGDGQSFRVQGIGGGNTTLLRILDSGAFIYPDIQTVTDGATTIDSSTGIVFKTANTSGTVIANFTSGSTGQVLYLIFNDALTSIQFDGANLAGNNGQRFTGGVDDVLMAVKGPNQWNCIVQRASIAITALADDATPSIRGFDKWKTGGVTTITDFDDGITGQIITVLCKHSLTFDTTTAQDADHNLDGSSSSITADTGDILTWWCEDGTTWNLISNLDASADNN